MRALGMVFRVYLSNILGAEGMGLYQLIFSVYLLASTIASAGITLAVTRLVSEQQINNNQKNMKRLIYRLMFISAIIGIATAIALYLTSPFIGEVLLQDARAVPSLQVLSISLPFMAVSAALRGYFMARRKIIFSSVNQMFEQAFRFIGCFALLYYYGDTEIGFACFIVMVADTVSEIISFIIQSGFIGRDLKTFPKTTHNKPPKNILKKFTEIALPVSLVRCINSALYTVENIIVPVMLTAVLASKSVALSQWGLLKGMALPLLMFPSSFLSSFVLLLIPEISENQIQGKTEETKRIIKLVLKLTFVSSIGISGAFYLLSDHLGVLIFNDTQIGFYLKILAPIMVFIYLENVAEGLLKGLGEQMTTLWLSVVNSVLRISLIYFLVSKRGMQGFLFVMIVSNIITSGLHLIKLLSISKLKIAWGSWVVKPLISIYIACVVSGFVLSFLQNTQDNLLLSVGVSGVLAGCIFFFFVFLTGCITKDDIQSLKKRK